MYLPFRIRTKYIIVFIIVAILLFSPGHSSIKDIFIFISQQFLYTPYRSLEIIQSLRKQQLTDILRIRQLQSLEEENKLLKKALQFQEERKVQLIGIEVVFFDPSVWRRIIIANVGKDKGIVNGLYVVDESGYLLGKVIEVNKNYSKILLVTDPDFTLPVFIGDKALGSLQGGVGGVKILYIENDEQIKNQDKVWIKTPYFNLPVLPIGEVSDVRSYRNSLFLEVNVRLFSANPFARKMFIIR